ncbi:MAG: CPBP family intramembrane glutamic endopeptidase [Bacteroidota bacterium]
MRDRYLLLFLPFVVLVVGRLGVEVSARVLPLQWSWIPAFAVYYAVIQGCVVFARRRLGVVPNMGSWLPLPKVSLVLGGVVLPVLLTLRFFYLNVASIPVGFFVGIAAFAFVNAYFEELFWRGLLEELPGPPVFRSFYSAFLFGYSHYFLWGIYWLAEPPVVWITTCVVTFIMGLLWSWFYRRDGRLGYPIVSHILVDVGNLSVAVFFGLDLVFR